MNDRQLLELAHKTLTSPELDVWFAKHYHAHGRHTGSAILNITPAQYRHRLETANRKLRTAIQETP